MSQQQVRADVRESRAGAGNVPDDLRKIGGTPHLTDRRGRDHRDRGQANSSATWRDHEREFKD